jgi:predicted Zn-ribbon and HTH transcriptional regulator
MVTIATFNEAAKAKHLKNRLQEAGVKADIHNEAHLQAVTGMGRPQASAKVLVEEADFENANNLLHEWESTDVEVGSAIRCPQCQSPRIEYPQMTRKFLTPWLASVLFALKIFPKEFYCQDCHFTWPAKGEENI